ncbi:MAG: hypothetical protein AAGJ83_01415 [Planctomycetota bacterium]
MSSFNAPSAPSNDFTSNSVPPPTPVSGAAGSSFVDRRVGNADGSGGERRQFGSSHHGLSEAGRELALAIDRYKLQHHRRYITCDEMLLVIEGLGYQKR